MPSTFITCDSDADVLELLVFTLKKAHHPCIFCIKSQYIAAKCIQ